MYINVRSIFNSQDIDDNAIVIDKSNDKMEVIDPFINVNVPEKFKLIKQSYIQFYFMCFIEINVTLNML